MAARGFAILWLVIGIALWNGVFDLYVTRGVQEYLHLQAKAELGLAPDPSIPDVMGKARRHGALAASLWAGAVVAAGWLTLSASARRGKKGEKGVRS